MCIFGDLAILIGETVFTNELDIKLERATAEMLGSTAPSPSSKTTRSFSKAVQACCKKIRSIIADRTTSEFDKSKLQEHPAKLSGDLSLTSKLVVRGRGQREGPLLRRS